MCDVTDVIFVHRVLNESTNLHVFSVCINSDFSIQIRSINACADRLQPCDHVRHRVPEGVAASAADESKLWTPRLEQFARS